MRDADDLRRRVKAARALAAFTVTDLAKALPDDAKLGARTLRTLEGDSAPRSFRRHELDLIARATGISAAFFDVDFSTLGEPAGDEDDRLARLEDMLTGTRQLAEDALARVSALEPQPGETTADTPVPVATPRRRGA